MRLTLEQLPQAVVTYFRLPEPRTLRLGQWFCNTYLDDHELPNPELFYEPDNTKALDHIVRLLVP
jgi:hypothetical protein